MHITATAALISSPGKPCCHSSSLDSEGATWKGDFRVFSPNHQDESVAARMDKLDPLDEPLSPLPDE